MHHRFDDSPDDYDMDMDQRTRMLGRGGRIILLGDGTEVLTGGAGDHDGDVDMDHVGDAEYESDERDDEAVQSNQPNGAVRGSREETPAPNAMPPRSEQSNSRRANPSDAKPEDAKTTAITDSPLPDTLMSTERREDVTQ